MDEQQVNEALARDAEVFRRAAEADRVATLAWAGVTLRPSQTTAAVAPPA